MPLMLMTGVMANSLDQQNPMYQHKAARLRLSNSTLAAWMRPWSRSRANVNECRKLGTRNGAGNVDFWVWPEAVGQGVFAQL
jgi:hypothetical protein